ncbi:MAG: CHAT domain-containing protein [Saprospiraceae bacterium]|nr:CHAT domain-containing protein [Saprospiraceae bacterium]
MGQFDKSEKYLLEAKSIFENTFGKEHQRYTGNLEALAKLYMSMGDYERAEFCFTELSGLNKHILERALHHLSEREMDNYLAGFEKSQNEILTSAQKTKNEGMVAVSYDNSLFYKGFLLNEFSRLRQISYKNPVTTEKYNELRAIGRRLATEYSKPIKERNQSKVAELEEKVNVIEKDLAQMVAGYRETRKQLSWKDLQIKLKPEEAAIEFVHFDYYKEDQSDSTFYEALVLRPEKRGPVFIPLFEQRSLDSLLVTSGDRKADYVNKLYTHASRGVQTLDAKQRTLYELIWKPLENELGGIRTIYYSPTGLLHRLHLAAIPVTAEENLTDRYKLVALNSTRQVIFPDEGSFSSNEAVLLGGLKYTIDTTQTNDEQIQANQPDQQKMDGSMASVMRGGLWEYLSGTDLEVKKIHKLMMASGLNAAIYSGNKGTEEIFKQFGTERESPKVLHIATHGYFFEDTHVPVGSSENRDRSTDVNKDSVREESIFKISENPMMRSGLILAGGNARWQGKRPLGEGEDGVLTAYEISQMNLSNTELVVLSACETGLGDIQGNEGVYGLQRAFKIAGVKYIIMSLWQVPDKQTSMLMITFYKKWLEEKMSIPDAFHAAQKELRDLGFDPYQWAGFVLIE